MLFRPNGRKIKIGLLVVFLLLLAAGTVFYYANKPQGKVATQQPTQEDMVRMVKPAVVRIVHHITGNYALPHITVDLNTLTVTAARDRSNPESLDEYISGSGFIVTPDGNIFTNSHVVSKKTLEYLYITDALSQAVDEKTKNLSASELKKIFKDDAAIDRFYTAAYQEVEENSYFNTQSEVAVLNPSSDKEDIEDLFRNGFPATVVSVNDKFFEDEKDVALVKINQNNLPTVPLAQDSGNTGNKIFIFGFPATAEFNKKSPLEATFTQGIISASKNSQTREFKVYQTDAKISEGSSGGPMFNDRGEVIGIITFQTGRGLREAGDNFAFAVPISLASEVLKKNGTSVQPGTYRPKFELGLQQYYAGQCKNAIANFAEAKKISFYFQPEKYVNPYIASCQTRIDSGRSLDSSWQQLLGRAKNLSPFEWFVLLGRLLLIITGMYAMWFLLSRMRKDEKKLEELGEELKTAENSLEQKNNAPGNSPELPIFDEKVYVLGHSPAKPHPHLTRYIQEAREIGMDEEMIMEDLRKAGWNYYDILDAMKK